MAPEYGYVQSAEGELAQAQGRAVAALLPGAVARGTDIVALVPAAALSWHLAALPARVARSLLGQRMEPQRARAVLGGVLEEQLLDDPERLHFAVCAGPPGADEGSLQIWVAACERAWLRAALQALDDAGLVVGRVVAEATPLAGGPAQVVVCADADVPQLLLSTQQGAGRLPLQPDTVAYACAQGAPELAAEPAVVALASEAFGRAASVQTAAQRFLLAAQSSWNLAQGEFSPSQGSRLAKRWQAGWQQFARAPVWRPVRWGLGLLVLVQLAALNGMAWKQQQIIAQRRAAAQAVLVQTFPDVQVVVDAPVQMRRSVDALALARGVVAGPDLGQVMTALAAQAPAVQVRAVDVRDGTLRLQTDGALPATLASQLAARGMQVDVQGDSVSVRSGDRP